MKTLHVLCILIISFPIWAAQKAKIVEPEVEIYSEANFDSDIISAVREGESYIVSDKTYEEAFYKIKLKNGKIGYIVDYALDIEGKGRFKEKDLDEVIFEEMTKLSKENPGTAEDREEEEYLFGKLYSGPILQLLNYHENTLGGEQVDDLLVVGYRSISIISWSVSGAFKAPKYYAEKTGGSANGVNLWADFGFSNPVANFNRSNIRFAGSLFTHFSLIQLETPKRKYELQDITLGLALEIAWQFKFYRNALDFSIKYYFDKTNYAGFGFSYLF